MRYPSGDFVQQVRVIQNVYDRSNLYSCTRGSVFYPCLYFESISHVVTSTRYALLGQFHDSWDLANTTTTLLENGASKYRSSTCKSYSTGAPLSNDLWTIYMICRWCCYSYIIVLCSSLCSRLTQSAQTKYSRYTRVILNYTLHARSRLCALEWTDARSLCVFQMKEVFEITLDLGLEFYRVTYQS